MGKSYTAKFPDGSKREVASFAMGRATLFYDLTKLLEKYVGISSGVEDDLGLDQNDIDPEQFVRFFETFWETGWLADQENSFVASWSSWAAGMVENITLTPTKWIDRNGNELSVQRYMLSEPELEQTIMQNQALGNAAVRVSKGSTNLTIGSV